MDATTTPFQRISSWAKRLPAQTPVIKAVCLGSLVVFWAHLLITTWGFESFVTLGAGFGLLATLALPRLQKDWLPVAAGSALLLLTVTSSFWWSGFVDVVSGWMHDASLLNSTLLVLIHAVLVMVLGGLIRFSFAGSQTTSISTTTIWSFSFGLGLTGVVLAPLWPTFWLACGVALLLMIVLMSEMLIDQSAVKATGATKQAGEFPLMQLGLAAAFGLLLPALYRYLCQLQPETAFLFYSHLTCLGLAAGWARYRGSRLKLVRLIAVLSLTLVAFPLWVRAYLAISATVSVVALAMLLRFVLIFILTAPAGLLLGRLLAPARNTDTAFPFPLPLKAGVILLGFFVGETLLSPIGVPLLFLTSGIILLATSIWQNWQLRDFGWFHQLARKHRPLKTGFLATACGSLLLLPLTYEPIFASRALFSTYAFQSWREGASLSELPGLDDGRLLKWSEGDSGTLTFWKHRGTHVQIRENGIPQGRISLDDSIVPQPTGALLGAVLPLSIHEAPREVLLLGIQSGLGMQTALEFPLMNLHCCDERQQVWREMEAGVLADGMASCVHDERVHYHPVSHTRAVHQQSQTFDVIIESPGHSASYDSASQYNEQHYRAIEKLLSEKGVYCQRFVFSDYGPKVLVSLARTIHDTFGYMTAFDTAPGEMLFVAARKKEHILSPGLIDRISSPQVSRSLSHVGWDWSVAMNLARFEIGDLGETAGEYEASVFKGTESFSRCVEMMRWGNKWGEVRNLLAERPKRFLEHYADEEKKVKDLLRRLSDVAAREQVLKQHPDEFWVYRKSVKKRLTDNPRSIIQPVKGEGLQKKIHPEDKRRLHYFETLGMAIQQSPMKPEMLRKVEEYAEPYDPLISHFLHAETAKLYQRCEPAQPERELRHWLYAVHYGGREERSVRGIHRSLELLLDEELDMTSQQRYDHANALLEILRTRWQMRKGKTDISKPVLLIDLKDSLQLSQATMDRMREIAQETNINEDETAARIRHLERSLIRHLRSYRTEMLAKSSNPRMPTPEQLKRFQEQQKQNPASEE